MKFVLKSFILIFTLVLPEFSYAQLDSSYELLLGTHVASPVTDSVSLPKKVETKKKRKPASEDASTNVQSPAANATDKAAAPAPVVTSTSAVKAEVQKEADEPSISQQAESIFGKDPDKVLNFYQTQFDDNDPRKNKVEIQFAPSYVTNESSSNYSYRDYRSVFTGMNVGANVWLTPAIGVGGNFMFSLDADTSGDAVTNTRSQARYEVLDTAVKFRKFFGFSQTSKSLEFDILYSEFKFSVPSDDPYRARLKSSGMGVKMTLKVPSSAEVSWLVGGSFYPRLQHSELQTGVDISSGNNTENTRMGLQLGSEIKLSRESQVFYEASVSSEKNLFDGSAGLPDPATGNTPKNVSVTDTLYMFTLGYRWGN